MLCIGLTGSIGSGKSTVLAMFKELGAYTVSADDISRELTKEPPIIKQISDYFGQDYLQSNGQLDRSKLRERIANDKAAKAWLEALLHPLIRAAIIDKLKEVKAPFAVIEIPLLYNKGDYPYLSQILTVETSIDVQIKRVTVRDACTPKAALALLKTQASSEFRRGIADVVIQNDGDLGALKEAVIHLHQIYTNLSEP